MINRARVAIVTLALLLAGSALGFAENGFLDFASPVFLGGGGRHGNPGNTSRHAPQPRGISGPERVTLDLSYIALTQLSPFSTGAATWSTSALRFPRGRGSSRPSAGSPTPVSEPAPDCNGVRSEG